MNHVIYFDSITKCSAKLNISRSKIKELLINGNKYKGYLFKVN